MSKIALKIKRGIEDKMKILAVVMLKMELPVKIARAGVGAAVVEKKRGSVVRCLPPNVAKARDTNKMKSKLLPTLVKDSLTMLGLIT